MYHLDPRPYPRLSPEQKERILRQVAEYFTAMEHYQSGQHRPATSAGEQLDLFSEPNVSNV